MKKVIVSVCSARPNFVKLAAVHHAIVKHGGFEHLIVHTGQHYDPLLSDVFFEQLKIPQPVKNLGVRGGSREEVIQETENAFAAVLPELKPDIVLVYGDVNGAVGAARATKAAGVRLAHVEAGLRSGDLDMPEEHNRIAMDQIADILFCTERAGVDHLKKEGVKGEVHFVGNTMIDTLIRMKAEMEKIPSGASDEIKKYAIATLHRPSNVDNKESLTHCMQLLGQVAAHIGVLLPAHPRLTSALMTHGIYTPPHVHLMEPMQYLAFLRHMQSAAFIMTDSGGIQEEAVLLGKRCFTIRKNTERPSTIKSGSNVLIDIDKVEDREKVLAFAKSPADPAVTIPELWDGKAGERIVEFLIKFSEN